MISALGMTVPVKLKPDGNVVWIRVGDVDFIAVGKEQALILDEIAFGIRQSYPFRFKCHGGTVDAKISGDGNKWITFGFGIWIFPIPLQIETEGFRDLIRNVLALLREAVPAA